MSRIENFIRISPKLFLLAAGLDFIKQVQSLLPYWFQFHDQLFSRSDYDFNNGKMTVEFVYRLIDVIIYPFGWVGSAIIITLLLEMRDKRRVSDA
jgi:hypothetical protein